MVDVNLKIPALEKLMDYTASGIGAVAGPMLAPWKARKEAQAKAIGARAEADSLKLIADAQADARRALAAPDEAGYGVLDIGPNGIKQRIEFQEKKRQANIASIVQDAAAELDGKEVRDHEPDPDWTARYFNDIQDTSSKELQKIWSKILSGEIESSGRTSLKTLSILKDMTQKQAEMFAEFSRYAINFIVHEESYTAINPTLNSSISILMEELSLAHGGLGVYKTVTVGIEGSVLLKYCNNVLLIEGRSGHEIDIHGYAMTGPGRELAQFHTTKPHMEYLRNFAKFLVGHDCTLKIAPAIKIDAEGTLGYKRSELRIIEPVA